MSDSLLVLLGSAAIIGSVHTLLGPDHYLPFVVISRARGWSRLKTVAVTVVCGLGHVASSVVLGLIGIAAGIAVSRLELIESTRGEVAAWLLIAFGLAYAAWGAIRAMRSRPHVHRHVHLDGTVHEHPHNHREDHAHAHPEGKRRVTPWILFTIFVFGPCEPLIPLLMYPAATESALGAILVATVFGAVTITTMTTAVVLLSYGVSFVPLKIVERHVHTLAGLTVFLCGVAIQLGL